MTKTIKFKKNPKTDNSVVLDDLKGKLFLYFKTLLSLVKASCPQKGSRCSLNHAESTYIINNTPSYFNFNLSKSQKNKNLNFFDVAKTFLIIPEIFELSSIFKNYSKSKIFYQFVGSVCQDINGQYSCFFRANNFWNFYLNDSAKQFKSFNEVIEFSVQNRIMPILIYYQIEQQFKNYDNFNVSPEFISSIENFCKQMDNNQKNTNIPSMFRTPEDILRIDNSTRNRRITHDAAEKHSNSTNYSNSRHTSNMSANNQKESVCHYCEHVNSSELTNCAKCKKSLLFYVSEPSIFLIFNE